MILIDAVFDHLLPFIGMCFIIFILILRAGRVCPFSQLQVCSNCIKFSFELHHGRLSWYQVAVAGPLSIKELTTGKSQMAHLKIQPCQYSSYFFRLCSD